MTDCAESEIRPAIDYKALLQKYIRHVVNVEGISFIDHWMTNDFTEQEREALAALDTEP